MYNRCVRVLQGIKIQVILFNKNGKEFFQTYFPKELAGHTWRAISWTTAAALSAVVELVAQGKLPQKGFIKQEEINVVDFFVPPLQ